MRLSARSRIPPALSVAVNQMVYDEKRKGRDIITLSLGEAFFDIPQFSFEALDFNRGYHYSDSQGIPELREKIAKYYGDFPPSSVLISAGSKPIIFMAMQAILDPGDVVVIPEPAWLSYQEQARLCNARVVFIPHHIPVENWFRYLTPKVRLVVINNPNNPSGRVYSRDELHSLAEQCYERNIWLLVDEAYSDFVLDDSFRSMAGMPGVVVVNSLSKNMGMSGWRVGYVIAETDFIQTLLKINQHIITCAPTILLQYLAHYFDQILEHTLPQVRAVVEKRARIARRLDHYGFRYMPGSATFYFFVNCPGDVHAQAMKWLREDGIAVVPGSAYGASTQQYFRMGIGTESEERIEKALGIMRCIT